MNPSNVKHLEMLRKVARRLGDKNELVVYVGGSVAGLFITDPAADEVRATADVDLVADVDSRIAYGQLEKAFRNLGFKNDRKVICRYHLEGLLVDLMPPEDGMTATDSNRWYRSAIRTSVETDIGDGVTIRLVTPPCFVATKLEAFLDRGKGDYMASHDLEDIIAIVDAREELADEIASTESDVREFISEILDKLLSDADFLEALPGHLRGDAASQARLPIIIGRLERIASL